MGRDSLKTEQQEYETALEKVDWSLPGMEDFPERDKELFTRAILEGTIVNSLSSLGWALWPTKNEGYYDTEWLRKIATFLEIQNKPFWDDYEKYCRENRR